MFGMKYNPLLRSGGGMVWQSTVILIPNVRIFYIHFKSNYCNKMQRI